MDTIDLLGKYGLIPVVVINHADQALPTAEALAAGGLPVMEITLRTSAALEAIRRVHEAYPEYILGAGTVLTKEQCEAALSAGASYIVSPGLNEGIIHLCQSKGVSVLPGCATPSEIDRGLAMGLHVFKFFPASVYGGVAGCKALYGPYAVANVRFVPTGGIHLESLDDYADKPFIHAVGGGWLADQKAIQAGDYTRITANAKCAIDRLLGFEVAHVGVNSPDAMTAERLCDVFSQAFGFEKKAGNSSYFAGKGVELLKAPGRGAMGHIAVRTTNVERAVFYLAKRGFAVDEGSARGKNGEKTSVYLQDEIGGFAVHLLKK